VTLSDPYHLNRFLSAQESCFSQALRELEQGQKQSHWMWFIFPQIAGLGRSAMAVRYAISSTEEARAYLQHEILRDRLRICARALLAHHDKSIRAIMGQPDDMKLRSSMTLFAELSEQESVFHQVIQLFYAGEKDPLTLSRIKAASLRLDPT
jgi:uncharacterized protein (DUF1810 family)